MSTVANIILELIQLAPSIPGLIAQIEALYQALMSVLSATDQTAIAAALAAAKQTDATATAAADAALAPSVAAEDSSSDGA